MKKKKKVGTRACAKPNQTNLGLAIFVAGDRGNPSWKRRKGTHWLPGVEAAGRTSGQLGSGQLLWARPRFHLPLRRLLGNFGGAPFERKRWANQEVRGEPLRRRGRLAHFPFLRALGTFAQQDRGTARASLSREPVGLNTRRLPQSCWNQVLQLSASATRERRGTPDTGCRQAWG